MMQKTVFIVDDNDAHLMLAAMSLEDEYNVLTMQSAERMFLMLNKMRPDLILLDIEMPETDGFEAIVKLKKHPEWKDIPVVFLTGLRDENLPSRVLELGAAGLMSKPFEPSELLDRVKKQLEGM